MIEKLIRVCATNKFLTLTIVAALVFAGMWSMQRIALDALPDLSDTQVIVYSTWDRSPDIIEDQVTYPIITSLLGAPKVKAVRGFSDFGYSYVYVIFDEGTDMYWARSRVLEYLSKVQSQLPSGVKTQLGPDATGVGWVFQYALVDKSGKHSLADLRSLQDWHIRYELQSVPGVAEVASLGGFVRQYQITVDPNKLAAYRVPLMQVMEAVRSSNNEVGGRLVEWSGAEYMVRARGYVKKIGDLEQIVVRTDDRGTPVYLRDVANVQLGPEMRRGVAELNGEGEVASGVVIMRHGENALNVIKAVKAKLADIEKTLPEGVQIVTTYDRSELIEHSIHTLKHELIIEMIIVSLVILIFLWHIPSSIIPIITIPAAVILSFIPMKLFGINANIMSLGGIAVAIGALVDASVVVVENAHKKLEVWEAEGKKGDYKEVLITAIQEVGRPSFFSLMVIAISFIPIFALEAQEGRLFRPLAFTKNFAMAIAAILAVTLDPAIRLLFTRMKEFRFGRRQGEMREDGSRVRYASGLLAAIGRTFARGAERVTNAVLVGRMYPEEKHPISRVLFKLYGPPARWVLKHPRTVIATALLIVAATIPAYKKLGHEFMPPLNEGAILYMPTTLPGISVTEATALLQRQDQLLKTIPEVERVFGKAGRADTSTDPAPFSMMETVVVLKPADQWRPKARFYSNWPGFVQPIFRPLWPDRISWDELVNDMNAKLTLPGQTNAWTMPIKNRIDMLTTGVRTPVGVKIFGSDLKEIEQIGQHLEGILQSVPGTRSVYGERTAGGYFVDFDLNREQIARYGLTIKDVQDVIMTAIGGENVTTTIEGRERYPVNIRYPRELRDDVDKLARTLVPTMSGAQIPLGQLATVKLAEGPSMIRDENGKLSGYVYVDIDTAKRDIGSYVEDAKRAVAAQLKLKPGYLLAWSGQYEAMARVRERMKVVLPLTLFIVFGLIYMNTKSLTKTTIVLLAVPFSAVGAVWLLYALGYNISIGVWVGLIALLGLDAETGIFMLLYLDLSHGEAKAKGLLRNREELNAAILHGAVQRVRPKVMTVACAFFGLVPIMWSAGTGADMMRRVATPMIGGLFTSFLMELLVYPAIYLLWRQRELPAEERVQSMVPRRWHRLAFGSGIAVAAIVTVAMFVTHRATPEPLFPKYEAVRQALLANDAAVLKKRSNELAAAADESNQPSVASDAKHVAGASDMETARHAFGQLSDAMIAYRTASREKPKPQIVYCSMAKHSWLQPQGEVTNPYYADAAMRGCGEIQSN
ncbi:MAG: efflux RND transporter permease subunit [Acidobacteria bacterium]|nr:efflux RND transporter permease subunit [Acidobacteriota bacterium]MBV9186173.1 efflux RND transporter permease subunit [Acidobacteriota bacterium]